MALADILFEDDFSDGNANGCLEIEPDTTYEVNTPYIRAFAFIEKLSIRTFGQRPS